MSYDTWKTTEPDTNMAEGHDEYGEGYDDGYKHGYESALHDAEKSIKVLMRTVQAYPNELDGTAFPEDMEVIYPDEALDALAELRKAKP